MPVLPTYDNKEAPVRSWEEVFEEFNRRHPDKPIPTPKTTRTIGAKALKKIKKELTKKGRTDLV